MSHLIQPAELRLNNGRLFELPEKPRPVCRGRDFVFAAVSLEHGHIYGMSQSLIQAGACLKWVWEPDPEKRQKFMEFFPGVQAARSLAEVLNDPEVRLVAAAAIPNERGPLGIQVMQSGKDYFTDKTPFTSLQQLEAARLAVEQTRRKFMVCYSERLQNEAALLAGELLRQNAIGRLLQIIGLGPHRLGPPGQRPDWFFKKQQYGGILCDIGSHQCEQFLHFANAGEAQLNFARAENTGHPEFPELEDFGEASFTSGQGVSFYFRVDWFTPRGIRAFGDGRTMLLGTDGMIELRKYEDLATLHTGNQIYLADHHGQYRVEAAQTTGFPFFGQLILDCLNRTETAMTQQHTFKAAELCLQAQALADRNRR